MGAQSLPPFLLTRPAAASARLSGALRDRFGQDIRVVVSPLMATTFFNPPLPPGRFDAVILTSEAGAQAAQRISAEQGPLPRRAYCVGDRTAAVAAEAGFLPVSAQGDVGNLADMIRGQPHCDRLLYLHGRHRQGDLAQDLLRAGIDTQALVVYEQFPCEFTAQACCLLGGTEPVILPLFSPRSADLVAAQGPFRAPLWVVALSPQVAGRAQGLQPEKLLIAARPDALHLLGAIELLWHAGGQA